MNCSEIEERLKKILKKSRFEHVLRVRDQAELLAKQNAIESQKVCIAALLHDCAKGNETYYSQKYPTQIQNLMKKIDQPDLKNPNLVHGLIGTVVAKHEYLIDDQDILNAILFHSTGRVGMTTLEKIIFLADKTERKRDYDHVEEIRKLAFENMDAAILESLDQTIQFLIHKKQVISLESIRVRNSILMKE